MLVSHARPEKISDNLAIALVLDESVICTEKSPIAPQLFCFAILIVNIRIFEDDEHDLSLIFARNH